MWAVVLSPVTLRVLGKDASVVLRPSLDCMDRNTSLPAPEPVEDHGAGTIDESKNTGGDCSEVEENDAPMPELVDLIRQAYPAPSADFTKRVMEQIRLEKQAAEEKAARQRKMRAFVRRFGGVAACLVLLCGVLALVYPTLRPQMLAADEEMVNMGAEAAPKMTTGTVTEAVSETYAETDVVSYSLEDEAPMEMAVVTEEAEAEEAEAGAVQEQQATVQVDTYHATALLKSVSLYAATENSDAAYDGFTDSQRNGFLQYLLDEGYFTSDEYQNWITARGTDVAWEPAEVCEAFGVDPAVYDVWLRK